MLFIAWDLGKGCETASCELTNPGQEIGWCVAGAAGALHFLLLFLAFSFFFLIHSLIPTPGVKSKRCCKVMHLAVLILISCQWLGDTFCFHFLIFLSN